MKLVRPTVSELLAVLRTFPPDAPFRIRDPDTGWAIIQFEIALERDGRVWVDAEYSDMTSKDERI